MVEPASSSGASEALGPAMAAAAMDSTSASHTLREQASADKTTAEARTLREASLGTSTRCCCEQTDNCFRICSARLNKKHYKN